MLLIQYIFIKHTVHINCIKQSMLLVMIIMLLFEPAGPGALVGGSQQG